MAFVAFFFSLLLVLTCWWIRYASNRNATHSLISKSYFTRLTLITGVSILLSLALRQIPLWINQQSWTGKGKEIMILLDVSKSMQVADGVWEETRLESAKEIIRTLVTALPGNKRGLGIFAGETQGILPITTETNLLLTFLAWLDHRNLVKQGTALSDALWWGIDRFSTGSTDGNILLIMSDGGEQTITVPSAIKTVKEEQWIKVFVIGIGSMTWWPIPEWRDVFWNTIFKQRQGETVISTLWKEALEQLASEMDGTYKTYTASTANWLARQIDRLPDKQVVLSTEHTEPRRMTGILVWVISILLLLLITHELHPRRWLDSTAGVLQQKIGTLTRYVISLLSR